MPLIAGKQLRNTTVKYGKVDQTGTQATVNAGDANVDGSGDGVAAKNHQHAVATAAASAVGQGNTEGASSDLARADHDHKLKESGAAELTLGAIADGEVLERSGLTIAGTADVVKGPATATDEAIARYDGATGKLLQDSGPTINDTGEIAMQSQKITGLLAGTAATDAINKSQLDAVMSGIDWKDSVRWGTDAALPANTAGGSGVGKTLTADANGALTVDGTAVSTGDRILVKDETPGSDNGIYTVTDTGDGSNPYILTRATDADENAEVTASLAVFVEEGSANADTGWTLTTDDPITVDTTSLAFTQFTGMGAITAGDGLVKSGSIIDVVAHADGSIVANADDVQVGVLATDAQHGVRGGGTQHALAVASGAAGFISGADQQKLDDIDTGATAEVFNQESVTSEVIAGTDTALADTLNATPKTNAGVKFYVNGILQEQSAGKDYTISGTTITILASSGTSVDLDATDVLTAVYVS